MSFKDEIIENALDEDENAYFSITKKDASEIFVKRVPANKFEYEQVLNYLKETYGGGDYRFRLFSDGKLKLNQFINIPTNDEVFLCQEKQNSSKQPTLNYLIRSKMSLSNRKLTPKIKPMR